MISRKINAERCEKHKTSGTAGIPIAILLDNHAKKYRWAVSFRQFLECGGRLLDKQVQLRGHEAPIIPNFKSKPFYEYIGLLRTEWIAIRGSIPGFVTHFLEEYRPDVMVGYPSLFEMLSEMISDTIKPRIIFCTGEVLSSYCRNVMNSTFGARIIDSYGCTEIGDIAWECPEEDIGYHVNADTVLVEFIKDGENVAPGEEGEIVLTNLYNYAMPLIRYNTGDVGVPSDEHCSCGRTLPLMQLLKGRSDDFIVLPDGKKLSPMCIKENFVEVSEYRIIQEKRNLIVIWLKMHDGYKDASVTWCASALRKVIGENVRIKPKVVNEIPRDNSGKLRRIISKVN
jgi:phenylacetate-CoA ligase